MRYEHENKNKLDSIELTLAMGCSLNCRYCPQQKLLKQYYKDDPRRAALLSFADFKKILKAVKKGGTICFSGMCEAFLNPECSEMIRYASQMGYRLMLLTTLVGAGPEDLYRIRDVEFDSITCHVPDREGNCKFVLTEEYLECLRLFHQLFPITNYSCHGTLHPKVEDIIDHSLWIESTMIDRCGNLDVGESRSPKGEIVCMVGTIGSYGNWTPEVLPDGTLLLCCMDYGMEHVLGNCLTMEVKDILAGPEYQRVLEGMKDDTKEILCRKCTGAKELEDTPAYHFLRKKEAYQRGDCSDLTGEQKEILESFAKAETICVFGMGKLFWDHFFHHRWNETLGQDCFCDNEKELWGQTFNGIRCISPEELRTLPRPLVITHMAEDAAVREQLYRQGIKDVIHIKRIYKAFQ